MKVLSFVGVGVIGIIGLLFAANEFIRVSNGPDDPSQGIVMYWLADRLAENASKRGVSRHLDESFAGYGEALALINAKVEKNENFFNSDLTQIASTIRRALTEAELVPNQVLDKIHPDMRRHFREEYQAGLQKMLKGLEIRDSQALQDGGKLCDSFNLWVAGKKDHMTTPSSRN
jgi:hypothetical protein